MRSDARLQRASAPVLHDVVATTGLRLQVSPWLGSDRDIGFAVHEAGMVPSRPVWEAAQFLTRGGDAMALHPLPREIPERPGHGDHDDLVIMVAGAAQDLVQMLLWQCHRDPTWPPCPAHAGRHPLEITVRRVSWDMRDAKPFVHEDTGARWSCPSGDVSTPIGQL